MEIFKRFIYQAYPENPADALPAMMLAPRATYCEMYEHETTKRADWMKRLKMMEARLSQKEKLIEVSLLLIFTINLGGTTLSLIVRLFQIKYF